MRNLIPILLALVLVSCSTEAEKIDYGNDQCIYCKMTIVDLQHSAQYVSKKGRQFKFDAIECMIDQMEEAQVKEAAQILVADYMEPGQMAEAEEASFIICPGIKSPMGAYLSAFANKEQAEDIIEEQGGTLYNWSTIQAAIHAN